MNHTTTKKAAGAINTNGLHTHTTNTHFPTDGDIQQGNDDNAIASQIDLALTTTTTEARIDSRLLAKPLGNKHQSVFELLKSHRADFEELGLLRFQSGKGTGGRPEKFAMLNEDQAYLLLAYSRNNAKTRRLKIKLVKAFSEARRAADVRRTEYLPAHHAMHDAIKDKAAGSPNERFMHINANKALNQLAGVQAGCRAGAGTLQQSLLAVGSALAARAVQAAQDAQGLHQHIKNALKPLEGVLSLGGASEAKP
jgi:phage regulator Rha-like protein